MTYNDLIAYAPLALISRNRDTVDNMETIVKLAQGYLVPRLDHDLFRVKLVDVPISEEGVIGPLVSDGEVLEVRSISVSTMPGSWLPLLRRSEEMLIALHSDTPRGTMRYYAISASGDIQAFPAPGRDDLVARVTANIAPPILSPAVQTNIIIEEFPELFQFATAMEVAIWNLDQASASLYRDRVTESLQVANAQISRRTRDESAQRVVETRNIQGA